MRTFFTIIFALIFIPAFWGFFAADSMVGYPQDTNAVIKTAKSVDLRGEILKIAEAMVKEEIDKSGNKQFGDVIAAKMGTSLAEIITEDWFYDTMGTAHKGLVEFIKTGKDTSTIELTTLKKQMRTVLFKLGQEAVDNCETWVKDPICNDKDALGTAYAEYKKNIETAMTHIPKETNLTTLISKSGGDPKQISESKEMKDLRENIDKIELARLAGIGALVILLIIIALINMKSLGRVMIAVGLIVALAGGAYIGSINTIGKLLVTEIKKDIETKQGDLKAPGEKYRQIAEKATEVVLLQAFTDAYQRSNRTVSIITLVGAGLFILGFFFRGPRE